MVAEDKQALVVSLAGEITWQNASRLRDRLLLLVQKGHRSIVLNMDGVSYVDSSGLAVFISLSRRLKSTDGNLMLINVSEPIVRALRQTRLCDYIPVVAKEAMRHSGVQVPADEAPLCVRTMSVPGDPSYMSETRRSVAEMLASLNLPRDLTYDLVLALGEALGNAFDHGGGADGEDGSVTVTVSIYRDRIVMEVSDCGCGCSFEDGDELPNPTEERGRGIRLMLMLADSIDIQPKQAGTGTRVRLVKMISPQYGARGAEVTKNSMGTRVVKPRADTEGVPAAVTQR